MSTWRFVVVDGAAVPYAAVPTLGFRLRVEDAERRGVHAVLLRAQIRIEPQRRRYGAVECERLSELFGAPSQWGTSLKPLLWMHASAMLPAFDGALEFELPVAATYDFDVAAGKYFQALDAGEIPLLFLFSGTVFLRDAGGFRVEQIPWECEATYRLPIIVWRDLMDLYFPGTTWIRVQRGTFDGLHRYRSRHAFSSWDETVGHLLAGVEEPA